MGLKKKREEKYFKKWVKPGQGVGALNMGSGSPFQTMAYFSY